MPSSWQDPCVCLCVLGRLIWVKPGRNNLILAVVVKPIPEPCPGEGKPCSITDGPRGKLGSVSIKHQPREQNAFFSARVLAFTPFAERKVPSVMDVALINSGAAQLSHYAT